MVLEDFLDIPPHPTALPCQGNCNQWAGSNGRYLEQIHRDRGSARVARLPHHAAAMIRAEKDMYPFEIGILVLKAIAPLLDRARGPAQANGLRKG